MYLFETCVISFRTPFAPQVPELRFRNINFRRGDIQISASPFIETPNAVNDLFGFQIGVEHSVGVGKLKLTAGGKAGFD